MSEICGHCKYLDNNHCLKHDRIRGLFNEACDSFENKEN
jgi:hypothetical protein